MLVSKRKARNFCFCTIITDFYLKPKVKVKALHWKILYATVHTAALKTLCLNSISYSPKQINKITHKKILEKKSAVTINKNLKDTTKSYKSLLRNMTDKYYLGFSFLRYRLA